MGRVELDSDDLLLYTVPRPKRTACTHTSTIGFVRSLRGRQNINSTSDSLPAMSRSSPGSSSWRSRLRASCVSPLPPALLRMVPAAETLCAHRSGEGGPHAAPRSYTQEARQRLGDIISKNQPRRPDFYPPQSPAYQKKNATSSPLGRTRTPTPATPNPCICSLWCDTFVFT